MASSVAFHVSGVKPDGLHAPSISGQDPALPIGPSASKAPDDATGPAKCWRVCLDDQFVRDVVPALKELLALVLALESFGRLHPYVTACNATLATRCGLSVRAIQFQLDKLAERGWVRPVYLGAQERNRVGLVLLRRTSAVVPAAVTDEQVAIVEAALRSHPGGVVPDEAWRSAFPDPRVKPASLDERNGLHSGERSRLHTKNDRPRKKDEEKKEAGRFSLGKARNDGDPQRGQLAGEGRESDFRKSLRAARETEASTGTSSWTESLVKALSPQDGQRTFQAVSEEALLVATNPGPDSDPGADTPSMQSQGAGSLTAELAPEPNVVVDDRGEPDGFWPTLEDRPRPSLLSGQEAHAPAAIPLPSLPAVAPRDPRRSAASRDWCRLSGDQQTAFLKLCPAKRAEAQAIRSCPDPTAEQIGRLSAILGGPIVPPPPDPAESAPLVAARGGPVGAAIGQLRELVDHLAASRDASLVGRFGSLLGTVLGREEAHWASAHVAIGRAAAAGSLDPAWFVRTLDWALTSPTPGRALWGCLRTDARGHAARAAAQAVLRGRNRRRPAA